MNATVTDLRPSTRSIQVPALSRDRRRCELERLAEEMTIGVPPSVTALSVLVAAYASGQLRPAEASAGFEAYLSEYRRWQAVEAGEPDYRDVEPQMAEADLTAALNDLLDGTNSYRGTRT